MSLELLTVTLLVMSVLLEGLYIGYLRHENKKLLKELLALGFQGKPQRINDIFLLLRRYLYRYRVDFHNYLAFYAERQSIKNLAKKYVENVLPEIGCTCDRPTLVIFDVNSWNSDVIIGHEDECGVMGKMDN